MQVSALTLFCRWRPREFLGRRASHQPYTSASTDVSQMALRSRWICLSRSFEKKWPKGSTTFPVWSYWYVIPFFLFFGIGASNFKNAYFIATSPTIRKILSAHKSLPELLTSIDKLRGPERDEALQRALGITAPEIDDCQLRPSNLSDDILALRELAEAVETAVRGRDQSALGLNWGEWRGGGFITFKLLTNYWDPSDIRILIYLPYLEILLPVSASGLAYIYKTLKTAFISYEIQIMEHSVHMLKICECPRLFLGRHEIENSFKLSFLTWDQQPEGTCRRLKCSSLPYPVWLVGCRVAGQRDWTL